MVDQGKHMKYQDLSKEFRAEFLKLIETAHDDMRISGFHEGHDPKDVDDVLMKLALIVTEVAEAIEEVRNGALLSPNPAVVRLKRISRKPEGLIVELADLFLRTVDLVGFLGFSSDFLWTIMLKMEFNRSRAYKHGKHA